jgi:hypothetical protein
MDIKVVNYWPSASPMVMAFVDVVVDGWLRFNGLNLDRDGGLRSAQLTAHRDHKRTYLSAVVILDQDLKELLTGEILAAITTYVASLPPDERMRPPRVPVVPPPTVTPEKSPNGKKALPPPTRLLIGAKGQRP